MGASLLYPDLVAQLILKIGKQQMQNVFCKKNWSGYQCQSWADMLKHPLFAEVDSDMLDYEWVAAPDASPEQFQGARQHFYSIFLERSSILFNNDATLLWLRETIGNLLNLIDDGTLEPLEFVGKVQSLVDTVSFTLDRYSHLKHSDFTDDVTTINPEELFGNGEQPNGNLDAGQQ